MTQLSDEILYDIRLVERHIRAGLITRKDVEAHLKAVEDQADQAEYLSFESLTKPASAGDGDKKSDSSAGAS